MSNLLSYIGLLVGNKEVESNKRSGNNYRRIEMTPLDWGIDSEKNLAYNIATIYFPDATKDWGYITGFGIWLSLDDDELLAIGELIRSGTIKKGDRACFEAETLRVGLDTFVDEEEVW